MQCIYFINTVIVPRLAGQYSGVITSGSAYTKASILYCDCTSVSFASTLYGECTNYSWTIYSGLPQRIPMHLLYTVNAPIIAGLYSGLPQRIPMHLLYTVNVPRLAGLYSGLSQRISCNAFTLYIQ